MDNGKIFKLSVFINMKFILHNMLCSNLVCSLLLGTICLLCVTDKVLCTFSKNS
jgi:hypothetical protein